MQGHHTKYCVGCDYACYSGIEPICDYIGITGHMRGCPPGEGCTKKKVTGQKRRRGKTWNENRALELYEEGKNDQEVADAVGATLNAIRTWRSLNHLPPNRDGRKRNE